MTLRAAIAALLARRASLDSAERPERWMVARDIDGRYVVIQATRWGAAEGFEVFESTLAETERVAATTGADLVEYLAGCAGG